MDFFRQGHSGQSQTVATVHISMVVLGLIIVTIGSTNLGQSTRFGLPREDTELKTHGLFRYSRNPIYLAFFLFSLAAVISTGNLIALILFAYSTVVYHLIILGEEAFLEDQFGQAYLDYKQRVRRYL